MAKIGFAMLAAMTVPITACPVAVIHLSVSQVSKVSRVSRRENIVCFLFEGYNYGVNKLKPIELRNRVPTEEELSKLPKNPIYIIIDNVLDTYNIGAIFRLADAVSAEKVFLCGETETPPNTKIKRASINTTEWVAWEYAEDAKYAITKLRETMSNIQIVAIEQSKKSIPYDKFDYRFPIAFVLGHETRGVSKEALVAADAIIELPMFGINNSLNVMVSLGVILYRVVSDFKKE